MNLLHRFSIKRKLIGIILGVSTTTIVLALLINLIQDIDIYENELQTNAEINATLIGEYCVAPLLFDYKTEVELVLAKLNTIPNVHNAFVYDGENNLFASYHRSDQLIVTPPEKLRKLETDILDDYLIVVHPIMEGDEFYGTVYLRVSSSSIDKKIKSDLLTILFMIFGSFLISFLWQSIFKESFQGLFLIWLM